MARFFSPARVAAVEPPALLVLDLLRLHEVDVPALKHWSRDSLELFWGWPDEDRQLELAHSAAEFYGWLRQRVAAAREKPGDDLFQVLVGLGLSDEEVCAVAYFLLIAGQETTSQLISAAYQRLIGQPFVGQEAAGAEAVEEVLRETSSVPTWFASGGDRVRGLAVGRRTGGGGPTPDDQPALVPGPGPSMARAHTDTLCR